jgi:hypothetical protein
MRRPITAAAQHAPQSGRDRSRMCWANNRHSRAAGSAESHLPMNSSLGRMYARRGHELQRRLPFFAVNQAALYQGIMGNH